MPLKIDYLMDSIMKMPMKLTLLHALMILLKRLMETIAHYWKQVLDGLMH